jgi:hypothetical protein
LLEKAASTLLATQQIDDARSATLTPDMASHCIPPTRSWSAAGALDTALAKVQCCCRRMLRFHVDTQVFLSACDTIKRFCPMPTSVPRVVRHAGLVAPGMSHIIMEANDAAYH